MAVVHGEPFLVAGGVLTAAGAFFSVVTLGNFSSRQTLGTLGVVSLAFGALLGIYPVAYSVGVKF